MPTIPDFGPTQSQAGPRYDFGPTQSQAGPDTPTADELFRQWMQANYPIARSIKGAHRIPPEYNALWSWWNSLSAAQKTGAIQQIQQVKGGNTAAVEQIMKTPPQDFATGAAGSETSGPTSAQTGATGTYQPQYGTGPANYPVLNPQTGVESLTPGQEANVQDFQHPGQAVGEGFATNPNAQLYSLSGVNQSDPTQVAGVYGIDPNLLQKQYASYTQGMATAQSRVRVGSRDQQQPPMTLAQFAGSIAQVQQGQWMPAINMISYWYQENTGTPLPAEGVQQIINALNTLPGGQRAALIQQMLVSSQSLTQLANVGLSGGAPAGEGDPTSAISSFMSKLNIEAPNIYSGSLSPSSAGQQNVLADIATAHPNPAALAATELGSEKQAAITMLTKYGIPVTDQLISLFTQTGDSATNATTYLAFMHDHHITPTAELLSQLMAMPFSDPNSVTTPPIAGSGGALLWNMPADLIKGATMGQELQAQNNIDALWEQYYGGKPSPQELAWAIGKSQDEIMNHILDSPSRVAGATIGRYEGISKILQDFNSGQGANVSISSVVDDAAVNALHGAIATQKTSPVTTIAPPSASNQNQATPTTTP